MDYVRDRPLDKTPSGPSQRDALPSSIVRFPAASAPVSPRPVASAAPQQAVAPRQQAVSPRPEPAKAAAAASAPPPSRVVATAAPPPQNPISPRPLAGSQTTRVTADFAIQIEEQLNEEAPVSVFSGAASASLDGLRYEFERERDKHVMETDKKGKTLVGAVRRWMIIKAASDGNLDLVKCCIKGGIPIVSLIFVLFFPFPSLSPGHSRSSDGRHSSDGSDFEAKVFLGKDAHQRFWISTELCEQQHAECASFCSVRKRRGHGSLLGEAWR